MLRGGAVLPGTHKIKPSSPSLRSCSVTFLTGHEMSRPPTIETGDEPRRSRVAQSPVELKEVIAAERPGYPFLARRTDEGGPRRVMLDSPSWRVTIGRDPAADVPLPWDAEVSRTHALLE